MAIVKTRNTIITQALRIIGVVAEGEDPTASQIQDSAIRLDWMIKTWQNTGVHLWKEDEATLFLVAGQQSYTLGSGSSEHATTSFTETTLSADEASGQTVLSVTSSTGVAVGDFVGVTQDDNTIHWSTLTVISPFTIADALTDDAASGNSVIYYTSNIDKPLRIPDARRRQDSQDIRMTHLGRIDYLNLPSKETTGTPVQYYYKPNISDGELFLWPTAQNASTQRVLFSFYDLIDVFDNSADAPDFPNEWIQTIVYNLAVDLAPDYGQMIPQYVAIKAAKLYQDALEWDDEDAPVYFVFSNRGE